MAQPTTDETEQAGATNAPEGLRVSFSSFVVSLGRTAMDQLGDPEKADDRHDLTMAAQTIALIAVLEDKSRGNLDNEEEKLLESVLYELRHRLEAKKALVSGG